MATLRRPDAMRRITVHFAGGDEATFELATGGVLHDQESLYQTAMAARTTGASESSRYHHGESSNGAGTAAPSGASDDGQVAADFEYAMRLQEMEDLAVDAPPPDDDDDEHDDVSCVPSPSDTDDDDDDDEQEAATEDDDEHHDHDDYDDDTDITYEQGQALVESVGNESRGLSDELISYLVPSKYKSGFFSRKMNHDDCPICLSALRNRENIITLSCKHSYHAGCITKWLKVNKICPVCKYEVFGPS